MKAFIVSAIALLVSGAVAASACGPDGKCVGKEKASCCMSKASAKKNSCSLKHGASSAAQHAPEAKENTVQPASANENSTTPVETAKADAAPAQPSAPPKR